MTKISIMTMVSDDAWMLELWLHHHAGLVGESGLFLILHNPSERVLRLGKQYQHIILQDDKGDFDTRRKRLVNNLSNSLLSYVDAVIHLDVDEFIFADSSDNQPDLYQIVQSNPGQRALFCVGIEPFFLVEDGAMAGNSPPLCARPNAIFSTKYSKPALRTSESQNGLHAVSLPRWQVAGFEVIMPKNLFLFHLKFLDPYLMQASTQQRASYVKSLPREEQTGPFTEWLSGGKRARNLRAHYENYPELPFEKAFEEAYSALALNPNRRRPMKNVAAGILSNPCRFVLPQRLQNAIAWPEGLRPPELYDNSA